MLYYFGRKTKNIGGKTMINNQLLVNVIKESSNASGSGMVLSDSKGKIIVNTLEAKDTNENKQEIFNIYIEEETTYVLKVYGGESPTLAGKMTVIQIKNLIKAYEEKMDKKVYFQKIINGDMPSSEVYTKAKKLHISDKEKRCIYILEPLGKSSDGISEVIKGLFGGLTKDVVLDTCGENTVIVKSVENDNEVTETAHMLVDMISAEAMQSVRIAYGNTVTDLHELEKSYREAKMALDIGKIFYLEKQVVSYSSLGVGRLIYQLPVDLCQLYIKEIFGNNIPEEIDDEMLSTVNKFFENNLNVSETSRQLSMHRNTLLYRIDKVQKITGLDIRIFDDALALKIALMVVNYIRYIN